MRISNLVLIAAFFIAATFTGCKPPSDAQNPDSALKTNQQQNSKYEQNIVYVSPMNTTEIKEGTENLTINVSGTMEPIRKAVLNSKEDGTCVGFLTKDKRQPGTPGELKIGTRVKAGDILVELEEKTMDQQIINLETQLNTMKYGVETDKVNEVESALALAKKTFEHMKDLYKKNSITETQYDSAKMQYEQAQAGYDKLILSIDAMEKNLAILKKRQADLMVRAPFDGRITDIYINPGELAAGMAKTPVVSIVDDSVLYFTFGVPEEYANLLNKETSILRITLNDRVLDEVRIATISPLVDSQNRNIICQARIENNSENPIIAGIFAKAEISMQISGIFVPETAIASDEDQDCIFIQNNMGFGKMIVKTGKTTNSGMVQILQNNSQKSIVGAKIVKESQARMLDADSIMFQSMNANSNQNQPMSNQPMDNQGMGNNPGSNQ